VRGRAGARQRPCSWPRAGLDRNLPRHAVTGKACACDEALIMRRYYGVLLESGFMPARRRYAGYLDDADGAKIGDGRVQVA